MEKSNMVLNLQNSSASTILTSIPTLRMVPKNHKGKFGSSSHENKVITIYENVDVTPPKCLIYLLNFY